MLQGKTKKVTFKELADRYSRRILSATTTTVHVAGLAGKDLARAHFRLILNISEVHDDVILEITDNEEGFLWIGPLPTKE